MVEDEAGEGLEDVEEVWVEAVVDAEQLQEQVQSAAPERPG